jgi:hypothetical protein
MLVAAWKEEHVAAQGHAVTILSRLYPAFITLMQVAMHNAAHVRLPATP